MTFTDFAPSERLMAAKAALRPPGRGITRVYLLRLTGRAGRPKQVPSSASCQGPGGHLWAYQAATGRVRSSRTPCRDYEVLAPLGAHS